MGPEGGGRGGRAPFKGERGWTCCPALPPALPPSLLSLPPSPQEVKHINEVCLGDCCPRGIKGQGRGHLLDHMQREDCWLMYHVLGYE